MPGRNPLSESFANEQPTGIGAFLASLPVDPSRSRTGGTYCPIVNAEGAYRGSKAPLIVNPLNASFVAQLNIERTFSATGAIRYGLLPLIHAFNSRREALAHVCVWELLKCV